MENYLIIQKLEIDWTLGGECGNFAVCFKKWG